MTLPQVWELTRFWRHTPPPALALRRISLSLGIKPERDGDSEPVKSPQAAMKAAMDAGLQAADGRPQDPMLDLVGW